MAFTAGFAMSTPALNDRNFKFSHLCYRFWALSLAEKRIC